MELIQWSNLPNFSPSEFVDNINGFVNPELLYRLQKTRILLKEKIHPSPVEGSFVRFSGDPSSQHYVNVVHDKYSTGGDVFIEGIPLYNLFKILNSHLFGGIGVYLETYYKGIPWVMFHLDIRPFRPEGDGLLWFTTKKISKGITKNVYHYPDIEYSSWNFLNDPILLTPKS